MKRLALLLPLLIGCRGAADPSQPPASSTAPGTTAGPADSAGPAATAEPATTPAAPLPLSKEELQAILDQPTWMEHLGGGVIDNACPGKTMDLKAGKTPSSISLTEIDGEQSFMISQLSPKTYQVLHDYLESKPNLPGRSFVYRQIPEGIFAGFQAFCTVDEHRLAPSDFTAAKSKNAFRIAAAPLAKLRALDPSFLLVVLTLDGTFVQTIPLEGLRKLKDPVITLSP